MKQNKIKIGIIGCGDIALQKHLPSLSKLESQVEVIAFCDVILERAENAKKAYGSNDSKLYTNYKDLLLDESIHAIHVCTPNISHADITINALESGKHVMCEKPMAINSEEAKRMVDAADRTGRKLTIGYQNRFRKDSQTLHQASENGDLGEVYFAKAHAVRRRGVPTWGVFMDEEKQGGGPLIDIGTHALDLTLWTMGNYQPEMVVGSTFNKLKDKSDGNVFGPWNPEEFQVEDSAFGYIKMKNGATIFLESSWALNLITEKEAQVTLCGTESGAEMFGNPEKNEGYVTFNNAQYNQLVETTPSEPSNIAYAGDEELDQAHIEAKQWIDSIIKDKEPLVKPSEAYVVTQILEAIYQSAHTGKAIYF